MQNTVLVGRPAPEFRAKAVIKDQIIDRFSLTDFLGKYVIFFFYPLDFTYVCPTELHAFQEMLAEFQKRNVKWWLALSIAGLPTCLVSNSKVKGGSKG